MDFFLYEILARVVAAYLFVDCIRTLRRGLLERKIRLYNSDIIGSILMSFMDPSLQIVQRDTAPIRYWMMVGLQIFIVLGCLGVAIFGWFHPNS